MTRVYEGLVTLLEEEKGDDKLIQIFHAKVDPDSETDIPADFCSPNSMVRCLISTIAFGMGMQIPDIRYVIHWGPPKSILDYWQEVGRCARDGMHGNAILYTPPHTLHPNRCDEDMRALVKESQNMCIRTAVLKFLQLPSAKEQVQVEGQQLDVCCSTCDRPDQMPHVETVSHSIK